MTPTDPDDWNHFAVITWLMRTGRMLGDRDAVITALGEQLAAAGAPVWRLRLSMRMLHPLVRAVSSTWEDGRGAEPVVEARHGFEQNPSFIGSPLSAVSHNRAPFRKRLDSPLATQDHVVLHELKARGATDYFALPVFFSNGQIAILVFTTRRSGGFNLRDLEKLETLSAAMAPVFEVFDARQVALAVAEAYLGPRTGRRVLDGQITRGDIETIKAAILISDLRGWTQLNRDLPPDQAVALANRYFETVAAAIDAQGGEILKFLGDGVLAVFPVTDTPQDACIRALHAASAAQTQADGLRFGIGLHFGAVQYGNVGSQTRIDFTVLGQAVNLAARIESQCDTLDEPVLWSGALAALIPTPGRIVANANLKGLTEPVAIHAPA